MKSNQRHLFVPETDRRRTLEILFLVASLRPAPGSKVSTKSPMAACRVVRTTLLEGGPGSGKTIMALQSLVHGARADGEPGIFVAFEEHSELIMANAKSFGWDIEGVKSKLFFPTPSRPSTLSKRGVLIWAGCWPLWAPRCGRSRHDESCSMRLT